MRVWYGFSKLTKKAVRKHELAIYFENGDNNPVKNENWINQRMLVVHERSQTKEELKDSVDSIRMFTKYRYFIDEKPWRGDIEKVLLDNFNADENHVSLNEREQIKENLRKAYYEYFNIKPQSKIGTQLKLEI